MESIEDSAFRDSKEIEITPLTGYVSEEEKRILEDDKPRMQPQKKCVSVFWAQVKAILYKNISFQSKQTATNLFQFFAPLICVLIIWVAKNEIIKEFKDSYSFDKINGIPFFLNMPFSFLSRSSAYPIASDNCNKWILYSDLRNKDAFGEDEFRSKDVLHSQFYELCAPVEKSVPYFEETHRDLNKDILRILDELNNKNISAGVEVHGLEKLPDAGVAIKDLSRRKIGVDIQINDHLYIEYHRNNGFTKQSFKIPKDAFSMLSNTDFNITDILRSNTTQITRQSQVLLNKTQNTFERLFRNKTVTFPVS